MKLKEKQQKVILAILAAICLVLAIVCVYMIACPGNDAADDPIDEEYVYNPGETGVDENGDTIIVIQDSDTDEMESIPNGVEDTQSSASDSDVE